MQKTEESIRIYLDDWLHPVPVNALFPEKRPLEIDMGCGKGRFLLARASSSPEVNFLGVDRMLGRLRRIDRRVVRAGLNNVRLLRMDAHYATRYLLPRDAVRTYYIFFPDPWPKTKHRGNRLFDADYLNALVDTLEADGVVHVATDHLPYADIVRKTFDADERFEEIEPYIPDTDEKTDFELLYIDSKPIGRCSYRKR